MPRLPSATGLSGASASASAVRGQRLVETAGLLVGDAQQRGDAPVARGQRLRLPRRLDGVEALAAADLAAGRFEQRLDIVRGDDQRALGRLQRVAVIAHLAQRLGELDPGVDVVRVEFGLVRPEGGAGQRVQPRDLGALLGAGLARGRRGGGRRLVRGRGLVGALAERQGQGRAGAQGEGEGGCGEGRHATHGMTGSGECAKHPPPA